MIDYNFFKNEKVIVTGHTGFKGSWLSVWLSHLGAEVYGISDQVPTDPSHYELIKECFSKDIRLDVKDNEAIYNVICEIQPDYIFHLAAQPIVLESYRDPLKTFSTNAMGTASIMDAVRRINHQCFVIMFTSDKCYDYVEKDSGYIDSDRLGGKDPYSGSKGAAELVIRSYVQSYFNKSDSNILLAIGRAGNVIGGGDWAAYRIVPDCVRSWSTNQRPEIRSPLSTRPWQHVLEPLSGYLSLSCALSKNKELNGEAFNFGPLPNQNYTVKELVNEITKYWPGSEWIDKSAINESPQEAGLLQLNCDKALNILDWQATLNFKETAQWTADWYRTFYDKTPEDAFNLTNKQIIDYMDLAMNRKTFNLE